MNAKLLSPGSILQRVALRLDPEISLDRTQDLQQEEELVPEINDDDDDSRWKANIEEKSKAK